jgi:hypothetical protein
VYCRSLQECCYATCVLTIPQGFRQTRALEKWRFKFRNEDLTMHCRPNTDRRCPLQSLQTRHERIRTSGHTGSRAHSTAQDGLLVPSWSNPVDVCVRFAVRLPGIIRSSHKCSSHSGRSATRVRWLHYGVYGRPIYDRRSILRDNPVLHGAFPFVFSATEYFVWSPRLFLAFGSLMARYLESALSWFSPDQPFARYSARLPVNQNRQLKRVAIRRSAFPPRVLRFG